MRKAQRKTKCQQKQASGAQHGTFFVGIKIYEERTDQKKKGQIHSMPIIDVEKKI